jgi:hypothetical protein
VRTLFNKSVIIGFFIAFFVLVAASSRLGSGEWLGLNSVLAVTGMLIFKSLSDERRR